MSNLFKNLPGFRPKVFGKEPTNNNRNSNSTSRFSALHENTSNTFNNYLKWRTDSPSTSSSIINKPKSLISKFISNNFNNFNPRYSLNDKEIASFKEYFTSIENDISRAKLIILLELITGYISYNFSYERRCLINDQLKKLSNDYYIANSEVTWEEFINILKTKTKIKVNCIIYFFFINTQLNCSIEFNYL
jgi:hypothetical protein